MPRWESFDRFLADAKAAANDEARQHMVDDLLAERPVWPWVEGRIATFIYTGMGIKNVALNLDTIPTDPPFVAMQRLAGTTLWYVRGQFEVDDLLDYMIAVNDPMTPLKNERNLMERMANHWRPDPRNPLRMTTAQANVSVLRMPKARPFTDWGALAGVPHGRIYEHSFDSRQLGFSGRKVWVYTPPGYEPRHGVMYPLLILLDGQWMVGPLQVPYIADALIKHGRMEPIIIAMKQSGDQTNRIKTYVSNDNHYAALLTELLPFLQTQYLIDSTNLGVGGVDVGAIAAAHAALKNPAVFAHLMMISPPMGKGLGQDKLIEYADRFRTANALPRRIFHSVGRYESRARFYLPNRALAVHLLARQEERRDIAYKFAEIGSGHGLVAFKSVLPEALAHTFPSVAEQIYG